MKSKLQSLGFSSGHAHLLIVAVGVFAILFALKSDINLHAIFAHADEDSKMLTFDDAMKQATAEYGGVQTEKDKQAEEQLALLDRSLDQGKVLGEAIGIGTIPNAENIFSPEQLATIPVITTGTDTASLKKYEDDVMSVESKNNSAEILAQLNSTNVDTIRDAQSKVTQMIGDLKGVTVPSELVKYHRYKLIYYQTLSAVADAFATNNFDNNFQNVSKILFSVMEKVEQERVNISNQFHIDV